MAGRVGLSLTGGRVFRWVLHPGKDKKHNLSVLCVRHGILSLNVFGQTIKVKYGGLNLNQYSVALRCVLSTTCRYSSPCLILLIHYKPLQQNSAVRYWKMPSEQISDSIQSYRYSETMSSQLTQGASINSKRYGHNLPGLPVWYHYNVGQCLDGGFAISAVQMPNRRHRGLSTDVNEGIR